MNIKSLIIAIFILLMAGITHSIWAADSDTYTIEAKIYRIATKAGGEGDATFTWPKGQQPISEKMRTGLQMSIPIEFPGYPFLQVIDYFREATKLNIVVMEATLEGEGFDLQGPITLKLTDVPFHEALDMVLMLYSSAYGSDDQLMYTIIGDTIVISTEDKLEQTSPSRLLGPDGKVVGRPAPAMIASDDSNKQWDRDGQLPTASQPFKLFESLDMVIAGSRFEFNEKGALWDGKDTPPANKNIVLLASPNVMLTIEQPVELTVGSSNSMQYFEKRSDGAYELKNLPVQSGLTLGFNLKKISPDQVMIHPLTVSIASIQEREKLEGVSLDVGKPGPVQIDDAGSMTVTCNLDKHYGIMWRAKNSGLLLITMKITESKQ